jgi:hypothetical protein
MSEDKLRVYFTVDTETSMGGAWRNSTWAPLPLDGPVFGRFGSRNYGIPLIMDFLEEYRFRGTFFTEVFCSYILGDDAVAGMFDHIRRRGHDAQLHVHPAYRFYSDFLKGKARREIDLMFRLPEEEQTELLRDAVALFRQFTGISPRAYRAGCYGASETTLRALKANGIQIDSSYNLARLDQTCGFRARPLNAPTIIDGVYEFPVTVFRTTGMAAYKELEVHAVSVREMISAIRALREAGCRDVVLSLHSFSFLKNTGVRYENYRPDNIVIRRFRRLCSEISQLRDEVEVCVIGEVDLQRVSFDQPQIAPRVGWVAPAVRKVVQGVNRLRWV